MRYRFHTADVFTSERFGGNQLAVLPDARGLTSEQMLAVTREFNYSESVFVLPPEHPAHTRRLRIFTPGGEVPFAGHPTVGTAHVLAATGEIRLTGDADAVVFEEGVGPVPVTIRSAGGVPVFCQLSVAKLPERRPAGAPAAVLADLLSLEPDDLVGDALPPEAVSCGLPFLFVPVRTRAAVARARIRLEPWERALRGDWGSEIMVFTTEPGSAAGSAAGATTAEGGTRVVRARVFVPGLSVPEDPATGSACAALGGYLAAHTPSADGTLRWRVEQGVEMGRPSVLDVEVDARAGAVTAVRVGGASVLVSEGTMEV
jgi:trans-2,3-dihydro-3-hydroxyanthranilate isomerase